MKIVEPNVELLWITPDPEIQIEAAGRTCYKSEDTIITEETADKFIRMILKRGHDSVIEHSSLVVRFKNLSRGFTHEQVRHRITGISQESTRRVDPSNLHAVAPPHRDLRRLIPVNILGIYTIRYRVTKNFCRFHLSTIC